MKSIGMNDEETEIYETRNENNKKKDLVSMFNTPIGFLGSIFLKATPGGTNNGLKNISSNFRIWVHIECVRSGRLICNIATR